MISNINNQKLELEEFKIDTNIAYFIGVLHSDGYIYTFNDRKRKRKQIRLGLQIGRKSIPMAMKFKKILFDYFGKTVNIRLKPNTNLLCIQTSVNRIWNILQNWGRGKLPVEIKANKILFGAYLAGLIDGDEYIQIKNNTKDRVIPQCVIRIASDCPLADIKDLIKEYIKCSVHFEFHKTNKGVNTTFYISKKSIEFIESYIYPHLVMPYKLTTLERFFNMKSGPARIRTPISAPISMD